MNKKLYPLTAALVSLVMGCAVDIVDEPLPVERVSVTRLTPSPIVGQQSTMLSIVDNDGNPVPINNNTTQVYVDTRAPGGDWESVSAVTVDFNSPPMLDVVIVADNSGSQAKEALQVQEAIEHFTHVLTARVHPDRVGLVRVSTESSLWQAPTADKQEMYDVIDDLFVANGWTALYDGIRLANEVLFEAATGPVAEFDPENPEFTGLSQCYSGRLPAIVAFTNGRENNSSDEHQTAYDGDGIDTTLDMLLDIDVGGLPTVVHTVGVGPDIDQDELMLIADTNDGKYKKIQNFGALVGALHGAAAQLKGLVPVCFEPVACHHSEVRVTVEFSQMGQDVVQEIFLDLEPSCDGPSFAP